MSFKWYGYVITKSNALGITHVWCNVVSAVWLLERTCAVIVRLCTNRCRCYNEELYSHRCGCGNDERAIRRLQSENRHSVRWELKNEFVS